MRRRRHHAPTAGRRTQGGVFAVVVGLLMLPLLGFVALALDIGRLYINKAELQNAADACALAAAQQLGPATLPGNAFSNAHFIALGIARKHSVDLQSVLLDSNQITIDFGAAQNAASWRQWAETPPPANNWRFARCTIERQNVPTWFLGVARIRLFTTRAQAIARIQDATSNNCGLPAGCGQSASLYQ